MSFEVDEDILQDFLIEAGEILDELQEQLVELENNPQDENLLNAIFRGYHTVKGGAGFLALTELVDVCHGAENVFDTMRNRQRTLTPELMDVILKATDLVVEMFERVKAKEPMEPASRELLDSLHRLSKPETQDEVLNKQQIEESIIEEVSKELEIEDTSTNDEITDDEFEALLDQLHGSNAPTGATPTNTTKAEPTPDEESSDDITDDEFEALLDQLHGEGKFVADKPVEVAPKQQSKLEPEIETEDISDEEFEALLDELQKSGKGTAKIPNQPAQNVDAQQPSTRSQQNNLHSAKTSDKPETTSTQPAAKPISTPAAQPVPQFKKEDKKPGAIQPAAESTVRVDTKRLDQIMNLVGELVLVRNRLLSLGVKNEDESMIKAIANLDVVTGDLQGAVMKTRMQPIKKVFGRFPRVVRDLARILNKEITLKLEGEETDLDKNLVEALADPLVHLVRNSVDHGIEMPADRIAAGKPAMGIVKLTASQEGDHILLTITDDGKGMDAEKLKEIAISRGVLDADAATRMTDVEAFNLIFAPGFSTKTEISDISGRGVGMDVVKTKINQLNGRVSIDSELGKGTRLEIKVPLTLAIMPTLMIIVAKQTFALPLGSVNEIINMDISKTNTVDGQLTMIVRTKAIPLFYLRDWLTKDLSDADKNLGHVVVVQIGTQQVGFVVDGLIGQEEVVIKPLDALLQGTPGMSGATITSDGGIALILDIPSMLKQYAKKSSIIRKKG